MNGMNRLSCPLLWFLLTVVEARLESVGTFWHIGDHHFDPYYDHQEADQTQVCPSSYGIAVPSAGIWGDHSCDSPWILINSSVYAMKQFGPDPDFILWTGDDTLHTNDEEMYLSEQKVVDVVDNITALLKEVFPRTKVFAVLGNHDYHPKSQIPPGNSTILSAIADLWMDWMTEEAYSSFNSNGFYTELFEGASDLRLICLNTNVWNSRNKQVTGQGDPGGQFQWMEDTLKLARRQREKVFIVGHIPPGFLELTSNVRWLYTDYNKRFNQIVTEYADVIAGQFFGHNHLDGYRMIKNNSGETVTSLLLIPAVTPWKLPRAESGGTNPGIRLYQFDKSTSTVKDYWQYYLDLEYANQDGLVLNESLWKLEYRATQAYNIPDVTTSSLVTLTEKMKTGCESGICPDVFKRFFLHNSASYNVSECEGDCQRNQLCAVDEVDYERHEICIQTWKSTETIISASVMLISSSFLAVRSLLV